jgi:hypothetical protein
MARARPKEGDDPRGPTCRRHKEEAVERSGWANWAVKHWATVLGREAERAESKEKRGGEKENVLQIFKGIQTNEFKHRFEFNQTKIVLQHECNNKLLWFINLIKKNN